MSEIQREFSCTPQQVFDVLEDGWLYATWVVGASRIRDVDATWPAVDSKLHHSAGIWPLLIDDISVVLEYDPPRNLLLRAKGWPAGEAHVRLTVVPRPGGCTVTIREDATAGPGKLVPAPIRHAALDWRNRESLTRLKLLAEGRATAPATGV
jgi:hypothetical protein